MKWILDALLWLHIGAGFLSVVLFWVPMFTKKGGKAHRRIGQWYVWLMWIVVVSAALLSIKNFVIGSYIMASFLGFISIITGKVLWEGIAILRQKKGYAPWYRQVEIGTNTAVVLAAVALIIYGFQFLGKPVAAIMFFFGALGLTSIRDLRNALKHSPDQRPNWYLHHLDSMVTSGIAAYTAFFVFGANRFISQYFEGFWAVIPWVAPGVLGGLAIHFYKKSFRKRTRASQKPSIA
ncbi:MAG: hypothetical protein AAFR61_16905 [Bacteroidota bacterium]